MNISNWLKYAVLKLKNISLSPHLDSELLLSYVLNKRRSWILSYSFFELTVNQINELKSLIQRRMCSEPISYLIGKKEFWSLSLLVSRYTLIPRPETEILVKNTLYHLKNFRNAKILDLGIGCGAISLALANERMDCDIVGVDCVKESINIARRNAEKFKLKNVYFLHSFWFDRIKCMFHIIVSNPPYIGYHEINKLDREVLFEPFIALISFNNGLGAIYYIIKNSIKYLYSRGWLLIEHSWRQKSVVQKFFYEFNFINVITYQDYSGHDRVTAGQKK